MPSTNPASASDHYDDAYFRWQQDVGRFGGWANLPKFQHQVDPTHDVLDFGCGGGYLLARLECQSRIGVEVNPSAADQARSNGIEVHPTLAGVADSSIDLAISNNALEHTLNPLNELKDLRRVLRPGGQAVFVVPCENISSSYDADDVNHHLYSWSPMCLGNLFTEAGFEVLEAKPYIHKWPPRPQRVARLLGRRGFDVVCRLWGRVRRSWFQVRIVAQKPR